MTRARTPRPRPAAAVALVLAATAVGTLAGPAGAAPRPFGAPRATLLRADTTRFKTFF
ncbi:hypothetical protein ACI2LJ_35075 [Streptomyces sp. NPDC088090]|uniref:hypothetical protein n=1 Tax=Streptomyces sp. NPDC088090 TaxID=3365822 RepID=UPI00384B64E9